MNSCDPHEQEDEGYLAAEAGLRQASNPYPRGTIRYEEWMRGWQIKTDAVRSDREEGYAAAQAGKSLADNPHPRGTIRYAEWRRSWQIGTAELQRAVRLGRDKQPQDT